MARIEIQNLRINAELNAQDARATQGAGHSGGANFLFGDGSVRMGDGSVRLVETDFRAHWIRNF